MNVKDILDRNNDGKLTMEDVGALLEQGAFTQKGRWEKHMLLPIARSVGVSLVLGVSIYKVMDVMNSMAGWFDPALAQDTGTIVFFVILPIWFLNEMRIASESAINKAIDDAYDHGLDDARIEASSEIADLKAMLASARSKSDDAQSNDKIERYFNLYDLFFAEMYKDDGKTARAAFCDAYGCTQKEWSTVRNRMVNLGLLNAGNSHTMIANQESARQRMEAFKGKVLTLAESGQTPAL